MPTIKSNEQIEKQKMLQPEFGTKINVKIITTSAIGNIEIIDSFSLLQNVFATLYPKSNFVILYQCKQNLFDLQKKCTKKKDGLCPPFSIYCFFAFDFFVFFSSTGAVSSSVFVSTTSETTSVFSSFCSTGSTGFSSTFVSTFVSAGFSGSFIA